MRVAILGGTGLIGGALRGSLADAGHEVVLFAREATAARLQPEAGTTVVVYDGRAEGEWVASLEGADAVVNMAGATIGAMWTPARKEAIRASRVDLTKTVVEALRTLADRPRVLVNASGAGYYGDRGDDLLGEDEPPGSDWLARLAADWEEAAFEAQGLGMRVVTMRTGIVFSREGGSLELMALPFRFFVGGPLGSGRQWFPWIHLDDIAGLYRFAVETEAVTGPLNACAGSERQREVARAIGRAMRRPSWLPAPVFAVRLLYGEFADALSASQRVSTEKVRSLGYEFQWPEIGPALADVLG
ncbi:MAG: TIGR01777 family oxidoreductase [Coriobacteriia bacterium]